MSVSDVSRKAPLRRISGWISLSLSLLPGAALAQAQSCHIPGRLESVEVSRPADEAPRIVPLRGYTLALSWSPQFCRSHAEDSQCDRANGRFGFIVHGLWPEGAGSTYPQWCASPPPLTEKIVRDQFCATPSPRLIAHEWLKHGTCAATSAADYFAASRKLFAAVRFPDMNTLSRRSLDVGAFKRLVSASNPKIMPSAVTVSTDRQGDWLREVHVCLSNALLPQPCPRNGPKGAPDRAPVKIWRGG